VECGVDLFWDFYNDHVLDTTKPFAGVYRLLEQLDGRKLAVVTNKPYNHTRKILVGLDMDRYFVSVQGWKTGLKVKPDPEMLLRAIEEAGADPAKTLMVGDSMADVMSSRAAGVKICTVGYGYGDPERLRAASPDHFVESVPDILGILE
jgi:HAD superfamily hydrolase (TIGR01509 family)